MPVEGLVKLARARACRRPDRLCEKRCLCGTQNFPKDAKVHQIFCTRALCTLTRGVCGLCDLVWLKCGHTFVILWWWRCSPPWSTNVWVPIFAPFCLLQIIVDQNSWSKPQSSNCCQKQSWQNPMPQMMTMAMNSTINNNGNGDTQWWWKHVNAHAMNCNDLQLQWQSTMWKNNNNTNRNPNQSVCNMWNETMSAATTTIAVMLAMVTIALWVLKKHALHFMVLLLLTDSSQAAIGTTLRPATQTQSRANDLNDHLDDM